MLITTAPDVVDCLWRNLPRPGRPPVDRWAAKNRADARLICRDAARTGWCGVLEAETVLVATGADVPTIKMRDVLALFGAEPRWLYRRPGVRVQGVCGTELIAAADLAVYLLQIERAGFDVDPEPLCEALVPELKAKPYLSAAELAVYWHAQERHRCEPMELAVGPNLTWGKPAETLRTVAGYKAELFRDAAGSAQAFKVTAPRWRRTRHPLYAA